MRFITRSAMAAATIAVVAVAYGCGARTPKLTADSVKEVVKEALENYGLESHDRTMVSIKGAVKEAIEAAAIEEHSRLVELVMERVKGLAQQELKRLNAAALIYKWEVLEVPIAPENNFSYFKQLRQYDSYTVVDIVELPSISLPFRLDIDYNYRLFRSEAHYHIADGDNARNLAAAKSIFTDLGKTGSIGFSYTLDYKLEWNGSAQPRGQIDLGNRARSLAKPADRLKFERRFEARWVSRIRER